MSTSRVFEFRTYTAAPGKLEALKQRFRDHTLGFFARHKMELVAFFEPLESNDTLVYVLVFDDVEAADHAWASFTSDPDWAAAKASTETDGPLNTNVETRRYVATDFSPLQ
jgi:hypothetical protein